MPFSDTFKYSLMAAYGIHAFRSVPPYAVWWLKYRTHIGFLQKLGEGQRCPSVDIWFVAIRSDTMQLLKGADTAAQRGNGW